MSATVLTSICVCVCACVRVRACVCVCACERERETIVTLCIQKELTSVMVLQVNKTILKMYNLSLFHECASDCSHQVWSSCFVHRCSDVTFKAVTVKRSLLTLFQICSCSAGLT